ncbi:MAG: bifunctional UDP-N-acetylglucosamine diphosphorylase/glucosamine-1-phosphate N-acetyltransferase GlmU [Syntrophomonadaceae bacterium]|nr:bifunctional UDP-N-acetylglucosamine diphosphorylase/glucosamine-1-phosphate N-acetyltransferase GlmU [Syntrophomonadaceae bacterium]
MSYSAVILAAGKGVRMSSDLPKVVHRISGKPIIIHVVEAVINAGINELIVVVGHGQNKVREVLADYPVNFVVQEEQLGTGHALMCAKTRINHQHNLLVLAGDIPLLQTKTIKNLIDFHNTEVNDATVLSTILENPHGYGRIVRNDKEGFVKIVEEKDAINEEKLIKEINSGIYCFQAGLAMQALDRLNTENAQGEYYLTDILEMLKLEEERVGVLLTSEATDVFGINDRVQLAEAQAIMYARKNEELMRKGVTIVDPNSTFIDKEVEIASDTVVMPFTIIEGKTVIGTNSEIGPYSRINDTLIGAGVIIENSRIREAIIGDSCIIGPFAYIRPEAVLGAEVKVGDFVEIKKSKIGKGSKIPHLTYIGDTIMGENVNVGAGTITCNYDGYNKYETVLEDEVFIGSNTNLVAPVRIGKKAVTGAGSTITSDVPSNALALERATPKIIKDWNNNK